MFYTINNGELSESFHNIVLTLSITYYNECL